MMSRRLKEKKMGLFILCLFNPESKQQKEWICEKENTRKDEEGYVFLFVQTWKKMSEKDNFYFHDGATRALL